MIGIGYKWESIYWILDNCEGSRTMTGWKKLNTKQELTEI